MEATTLKNRTMKLALGTVLGLSFLSSIAGAQVIDTSATATIDIQSSLSLTLVTSPNWGRVTRPPSGTARYTLDYSSGATSLVSGDGYAFSDGAAGEFTLTGAASAPVTFSMSIGAFSGATPVTVFESHINGTSDNGTGTLSGGGSLTLLLGGTLDVSSTATLGVQTATVTVTADYQ
jgi:hypothetical protein